MVATTTLGSLAAENGTNGRDNGSNGRLVGGAGAGTMEGALIQSYQNNPQLNAQRAATRATDENVPTALAGYRPKVTGTSSLTEQYLDTTVRAGSTPATGALYSQTKGAAAVSSFGLTATQTLWNGLQTASRTRQAEGQVFSARETLRTTEQNTLLNAATAYMNLLQTAAILELQRSNVNVLEVTLRQTRDRFSAGEVTRTDVAQAESRLAAGRSQLSLAESNYVAAQAQYQQVIGVPPPPRLAPAPPVDRLSPRHARRRDRPRPHRASADHHLDVQRRHRARAGQARGGRAHAHPVRSGERAEDLRLDPVAGAA
jgi:outer membrane protein